MTDFRVEGTPNLLDLLWLACALLFGYVLGRWHRRGERAR